MHWRKTLHLYSGAGITGAGYFPVYLLYVLYSMRLKGIFRTENELTYMQEKNQAVVFSASQRLFTGYTYGLRRITFNFYIKTLHRMKCIWLDINTRTISKVLVLLGVI